MSDIHLAKSTMYALMALTQLGEPGSEPLSCSLICRAAKLPDRYVMQVLIKLSRAGLVRGKRGATGGYVLAKRRSEISVLDAVQAIEGSVRADATILLPCLTRASAKVVAGTLDGITTGIQHRLARLKLPHLTE